MQYILKEEESSLLPKFFRAQNSGSLKSDWALTVKKDLQELDINLSFEDMRITSKRAFKSLVAKATTNECSFPKFKIALVIISIEKLFDI